jgi:uncharacterized protein with FMN-binding domain
MRRVILAIAGTVAGLVALLSFKSHLPSVPSAVAATTGEFPQGSLAGKIPATETAVNGHVANTAYGPVQIQLIMRNSKIVKVAVLIQPANTINDIQIGQFAFPKLISETLTAQTAKIDAVSGASYTSAGYIQSLQSALDNRG